MIQLPARWACPLIMAMSAAACSGIQASPGTAASSSVPATATRPTPSPSVILPGLDGQIVFVDYTTQHEQIYIEQADGSNVRRLVTSTAEDVTPSFSPDGRMVVFTRSASPTPDGIFVVAVDGSGLHQLKPDGLTIPRGGCPNGCGDSVEGQAWSPDGAKIVFTRAIPDATGLIVNVGLWVMNADGSGAHQITLADCPMGQCAGTDTGGQDNEASWSPDGKRIVFLRDAYTKPERYVVFTVAADGTDLRQVTQSGMDVGDPAWSPDGSLIAFQSPPEANAGGEQNIYTMKPDGTALTQLTAHLSSFPNGMQGTFHPTWSPDGRQIAFAHDPGMNDVADLFVMDRDGGGLRLIAATALNENAPVWGLVPTP